MPLPSDALGRKEIPIWSGVFQYFPRVIPWLAHLSWVGNQQHNPGQPLHWARSKSNDHADCLLRHQLQVGTIDTDGIPHSIKVVWRACAQAELELEAMEQSEGQQ